MAAGGRSRRSNGREGAASALATPGARSARANLRDGIKELLRMSPQADASGVATLTANSAAGRAKTARALAALSAGDEDQARTAWAAWMGSNGVTVTDEADSDDSAGAGAGAGAGPVSLEQLLAGTHASDDRSERAAPPDGLGRQWRSMVLRGVPGALWATKADRSYLRLASAWWRHAVASSPLDPPEDALKFLRGRAASDQRALRKAKEAEEAGRKARATQGFEAWKRRKAEAGKQARRRTSETLPREGVSAGHVRSTLGSALRSRWDGSSSAVTAQWAAPRTASLRAARRMQRLLADTSGPHGMPVEAWASRALDRVQDLQGLRDEAARRRLAQHREARRRRGQVRRALADIDSSRACDPVAGGWIAGAAASGCGRSQAAELLREWATEAEPGARWLRADAGVELRDRSERETARAVLEGQQACLQALEAETGRLGGGSASDATVDVAVPAAASESGFIRLPEAAALVVSSIAGKVGLASAVAPPAEGRSAVQWHLASLDSVMSAAAQLDGQPDDEAEEAAGAALRESALQWVQAVLMCVEAARAVEGARFSRAVRFLALRDGEHIGKLVAQGKAPERVEDRDESTDMARVAVPDEEGHPIEDEDLECEAVLGLGDAVLLEGAWGREWHTVFAIDAASERVMLCPSLTLTEPGAGAGTAGTSTAVSKSQEDSRATAAATSSPALEHRFPLAPIACDSSVWDGPAADDALADSGAASGRGSAAAEAAGPAGQPWHPTRRARARKLSKRVPVSSLRGLLARRGPGWLLPADNPFSSLAQCTDLAVDPSSLGPSLGAALSLAEGAAESAADRGPRSSTGTLFTVPRGAAPAGLALLEAVAASDRRAREVLARKAAAAAELRRAKQKADEAERWSDSVAELVAATASQLGSAAATSASQALTDTLALGVAARGGCSQQDLQAFLAVLESSGRLAAALDAGADRSEVVEAAEDEIASAARDAAVSVGLCRVGGSKGTPSRAGTARVELAAAREQADTAMLRAVPSMVDASWALDGLIGMSSSCGLAASTARLREHAVSMAHVDAVAPTRLRAVAADSASLVLAWDDDAIALESNRVRQLMVRPREGEAEEAAWVARLARCAQWELEVRSSDAAGGWARMASVPQQTAVLRGVSAASSFTFRLRRRWRSPAALHRETDSTGSDAVTGWVYAEATSAPSTPPQPRVRCEKLVPRGMGWVEASWPPVSRRAAPGARRGQPAQVVYAVQCRVGVPRACSATQTSAAAAEREVAWQGWQTVGSCPASAGKTGFGWLPSSTIIDVRLVASAGQGFPGAPGEARRWVVPLPVPGQVRVVAPGTEMVELSWAAPSWSAPDDGSDAALVAVERGALLLPGDSISAPAALASPSRVQPGGAGAWPAGSDGAAKAESAPLDTSGSGSGGPPAGGGAANRSSLAGEAGSHSLRSPGFDWYPIVEATAPDTLGSNPPNQLHAGRTFWYCPATGRSIWDVGAVARGRRGQTDAHIDRVRAGPLPPAKAAQGMTVAQRHPRWVRVWSAPSAHGASAAFWWDCRLRSSVWELPASVALDEWGWPSLDGDGLARTGDPAGAEESPAKPGMGDDERKQDRMDGEADLGTLQAEPASPEPSLGGVRASSDGKVTIAALAASRGLARSRVAAELWATTADGKAMSCLYHGHNSRIRLSELPGGPVRVALRWVDPVSGATSALGEIAMVAALPPPVVGLSCTRATRHSLSLSWGHAWEDGAGGTVRFSAWIAQGYPGRCATGAWRKAYSGSATRALVSGLASGQRVVVAVQAFDVQTGQASGRLPGVQAASDACCTEPGEAQLASAAGCNGAVPVVCAFTCPSLP